jgi:cell division protein FtsZ
MLDIMLEEETNIVQGANLKVIGIGGAGCNAVNWMMKSSDLDRVDFIVTNTDAQSLDLSAAKKKIHLGVKITKGLGAGSNPDLGRRAAEEDIDAILESLEGTDILFLTAGLGGGTGTGALPVIASAAKELGILTIAIVTKPFLFEGKRRLYFAEEAIKHLKNDVDTLLVVPNQRLLEISDKDISMLDAFAQSNDILKQAVKGISDIITKAGHINVDFADVRSIMKDMGMAIMGTGRASGQDRARNAALKAISSPLLEEVNIQGARGVLINITGNENLGLYEINDAAMLLYEMVREDANIILGSVVDNSVGDEIVITVIATGFGDIAQPEKVLSTARMRQEDSRYSSAIDRSVPRKPIIQEYSRAHQRHCEPVLESAPSKFSYEQEVAHESEQVSQMAPTRERAMDKAAASFSQNDEHDLDAPTFLRKNARLGDSQLPE